MSTCRCGALLQYTADIACARCVAVAGAEEKVAALRAELARATADRDEMRRALDEMREELQRVEVDLADERVHSYRLEEAVRALLSSFCSDSQEDQRAAQECLEKLLDEHSQPATAGDTVPAEALNALLFDLVTDESEVEHQISCHADTLPDTYRHVCATVEKVRRLLDGYQRRLVAQFDDAILVLPDEDLLGAAVRARQPEYCAGEPSPSLMHATTADIDAVEFERRMGVPPVQDDLDRVNCKKVGELGHWQCGWCSFHGKPRFMCSCRLEGKPCVPR